MFIYVYFFFSLCLSPCLSLVHSGSSLFFSKISNMAVQEHDGMAASKAASEDFNGVFFPASLKHLSFGKLW